MHEPIDIRLAELAQRFADDTLDAAATDELNALLRGEPAMRDAFVGYCIHARLLSEELARRSGDEAAEAIVVGHRSVIARIGGTRRLAVAIAAMLLIAGAGVGAYFALVNPQSEIRDPKSATVAVLLDADADVAWTTDPLSPGDDIPAGDVAFDSGRLEMQLRSGVTVKLAGAARFRIDDPMRGRLTGGRLVATVPHKAIGFAVDTPDLRITDLGTVFGVRVGESGASEVHVFEGHVRIDRNGQSVDLAAPAAVRRIGDALVGEPLSIWRFPELAVERDEPIASLDFDGAYDAAASGGSWRAVGDVKPLRDGAIALDGGAKGAKTKQTVFVDLDTGADGALAALDALDDGGRVGRSGRTIWLSWTMRGPGRTGDGWAGLSFFDGTDDRTTGERFFVGKASGYDAFSYAIPGGEKADLDADAATEAVDLRFTDDRPHRLLVRIELRDGADRVSMWIDPDAANHDAHGAPHAVVDSVDLRFDRLRLEAGEGSGAWAFDDLRIGPTRRSVLPHDTNGTNARAGE